MNREYHKWHSNNLGRDMELLVYGHHGARVLVFPTSNGRFFDWENRGLINCVEEHINNGWLQLYVLDGVDPESWFNRGISPTDRARRHLQYQDYVVHEVLPFSQQKNDNPYVIATGASFGAYHSVSIAMRYPECISRVLAMSGVYEVREWSDGEMNDVIKEGSPTDFLAAQHDHNHLEKMRKVDWIIVVGNGDPLFGNNQHLDQLMWDKNIWHAFRVWDGFAHDWPQWYEMLPMYINGAN